MATKTAGMGEPQLLPARDSLLPVNTDGRRVSDRKVNGTASSEEKEDKTEIDSVHRQEREREREMEKREKIERRMCARE